MKRILVAVAALLVLAAAPAGAQNIIRVQLDSATAVVGRQNYQPYGTAESGNLARGRSSEFSVSLAPGKYIIAAVCDGDCDDLDLYVSNTAGSVGSDELEDDVPMVEFTVEQAGLHTVRVSMAACSAEPCAWGAKIFAQGGSGTKR
jgi:hypothetical protein